MKLKSVVFALMLAVPMAASAQSAGKIATVNFQKVMKDSLAAQSIREQVEKKRGSFKDEINKQEEKLRAEQQELVKQRNVLAPDAFEKKKKEFEGKVANLQKTAKSKAMQLEGVTGKASEELQKTLHGIVEDMAKERGFEVVVPTSQLLYASPSLDITEEVLKRLNDKLPKVSVPDQVAAESKADDKSGQ